MREDDLRIIYQELKKAVQAEREECAAMLDDAAVKLYCGKARINQVDAHTASVLRDMATKIRGRA